MKHIPKCTGYKSTGRHKTKCLVEGCTLLFIHKTLLIDHIKVAHPEVKVQPKVVETFQSAQEFNAWKDNEEEQTFSHYVSHCGQKSGIGSKNKIYYLYCQHDSTPEKVHSKLIKGRASNSKGKVKKGQCCISKMKYWSTENGSIHVEYYPTHNHRLCADDYVHHPLPSAMNTLINDQISTGKK
uniref:C2H2-type domain-containing protein n=1 Tax=Cacopsylla melanoneura TaxID=428564 RepID=A0A8D9E8C1_9HEMI